MWGTSKLQAAFLPRLPKTEKETERQGGVVEEMGRESVLTEMCGTAITFMAQWHPLIAPESGTLRPEHAT